MLVKALRLFHKDVKLTAEELRAQTPMIGRLQYKAAQYAGRDGRGALTCMLMPQEREKTEPLVQLYSARIKIIDDRGMRIHGEEDEWRRKERTTYKQVLWCWSDDGVLITVKPPVNAYLTAGKRALA